MYRSLVKLIEFATQGQRAPDWVPQSLRRLASASVQALQRRYHERSLQDAIRGRRGNLDQVVTFIERRALPLRAPLVLISQVQRSGGSLLSQLFDGHPAFAAYPQELRFGFAEPDRWPRLDPGAGADANFRALYDLKMRRLMQHGYNKGGEKIFSADEGGLVERQTERYRFILLPRIQYLVFKQFYAAAPPQAARDILDWYFTAFFNAWLDYQGRLDRKKWISAFAPRLANDEADAAAFFATYPDGRLIQIIRDPRSWYPSAKNHRKSVLDGKEADALIALWAESAESMKRNKSRYGERVIILGFEDLVGRTEETMRALARALAVDYDPILLEPTFNGQRIRANSSFAEDESGVIAAPLARANLLSEDERVLLDRNCLALYEDVSAHKLAVADFAGVTSLSRRA